MQGGWVHRGVARLGAAVAQGLRRRLTGRRAWLDLVLDTPLDDAAAWRFLSRLRAVRHDPAVVGVRLVLHATPGGWALGQDLRRVLKELVASGRRVRVYLEGGGHGALWIASAASEITLLPTGQLDLEGVGSQMVYLGPALERLGLRADLASAGVYKSFGEPWTRGYPSVAHRDAVGQLVAGLQAGLFEDLCADRGLVPEALEAAFGRGLVSAEEALEVGLVDALAYEDADVDDFVDALGGEDHVRRVPFGRWAAADAARVAAQGLGRRHQIALVHLQGGVAVDGPRGRPGIRAREVVPLLDALREDASVEAVVLHVASRGGSALASDLIWRAVDRLREAKPVVAAFGDIAASGGVYLAASASEIVARPRTLTGSIGVVGGKLVVADALRQAGGRAHTVAAAPRAGWLSPLRPFDADERATFQGSLQRTYEQFVARVAAGRGRDVEDVEPACRGRVWSGEEALRHGLIDRTGDVWVALDRACALAGLAPGHTRIRAVQVAPAPLWRRAAAAVGQATLRGAHASLPLPRRLAGVLAPLGAAVDPFHALLVDHPGEALAFAPVSLPRLR